MSTQRPAFALLLLILFGIGGVAAPIAHEIDHSHRTHTDGLDHAGTAAHEQASDHGPCLCAVSLAALISSDVSFAGTIESSDARVDVVARLASAASEQPNDRGPPARADGYA